jgi:hypothetical protein
VKCTRQSIELERSFSFFELHNFKSLSDSDGIN